jgi:coenzyme F420-reducing hydrogenase gamma subunit
MERIRKVVLGLVAGVGCVIFGVVLLLMFAQMKHVNEIEEHLAQTKHIIAVGQCAAETIRESMKNGIDTPLKFSDAETYCEVIVSERESVEAQAKEFWNMLKSEAKYLFN